MRLEEQGSRRWLVVADMTDMRRWGELRSVAGIAWSSVGEGQVVLSCVGGWNTVAVDLRRADEAGLLTGPEAAVERLWVMLGPRQMDFLGM